MTYVFDIDGTICSLTNGKYEDAEPFRDRINKINELYDEGHTITFHTARGMGRYNNNRSLAESEFWTFTRRQLEGWGVKFHHLLLGKPSGDMYVDDKGISDKDYFND